ncbi:MAG: nicotinamide-nucleotide amidohydrolase family protein [Bacteroidales bacterium]|nr:nicotinamide-nucleotide amidohydrolase family protein [Bacteroidales bacterium]MDD3755395.1 nicotinamide-nucleotide amidohydrolase family protein [Bacteroidales bacterium]MDY0400401.1 nicotinamide-nucleotide amidohydrolase family protein [Bacteroidales bacterium]HOB76862.1 nicotinamide-nucleotide amidohydrolase family protein [Bacteroidales bacterium]HPZ60711.1 nicotinamide-nucleotide amidohydrolase family protein [Bacteroidales bacterium]
MNIAILSIGDEILRGIIDNKNASYIANKLFMNGFNTKTIISISDNLDEIVETLNQLSKSHEIIISTGGLGPTPDDKTIEAIAKWSEVPLVENNKAKQLIKNHYKKRNVQITQMRKKMFLIPETSELLPNSVGAAPGIKITKGNTTLFALPGVPQEAQAVLDEAVLPWIIQNYSPVIWTTALTFRNIRESELATYIESKINDFDLLTVAYLPSFGYVRILFSANKDYTNDNSFNQFLNDLIFKYQEFFVYKSIEKPEQYLHKLMLNTGTTLCTIESCTGGIVASKIVSNAGSSEYFRGSLICYSNEIKEKILKVPKDILTTKGAVSEETVKYMAENGKNLFNTDYSIAISGIAGPTGATPNKPVGLVHFAISTPSNIYCYKFVFHGNREINIESAANTALLLLIQHIEFFKINFIKN